MPSFDPHDAHIRAAAFEWLSEQVARHGDVLPRDVIAQGLQYDGDRVPLVGPQGIFKPRVLDVPISITTTPNSPYDDAFGEDGLLQYRYRGTDPEHRDNRGLRFAVEEGLPLIYFHGVIPGKYVAAWPVYIVGDDPGALRRECAFCRFHHEELLDAAHILPDSEPEGEPVVSNGMSLCRLHHAAFDRHFVGVTPDYELEVRPDILEEEDGPTLVHGLQALDGQRIALPRRSDDRPDPELLERRYTTFRREAAGAG